MIRYLVTVCVVVGFLIFSIPTLLWFHVFGKKNPQKVQEQGLKIIQSVFRMCLWVTGSDITIKGQENIPEGAVLYVANHRGCFDILLGYTTVPGLTGFVAKKEMEKIPLLSNWMRIVNCLFLDRKNMKEGLKTILEGIDKAKHGISIWIFPEGTRNKGELLDLLPFKEGSMKIAEKSGCPIVPVAITGSAEIFESHFPYIRPAKVVLEYGTPIIRSELDVETRKRLGAYTRDVIIEMLQEEQGR